MSGGGGGGVGKGDARSRIFASSCRITFDYDTRIFRGVVISTGAERSRADFSTRIPEDTIGTLVRETFA